MKSYNPLIDDLITRFSYDSVFAPNNEVVKLSENDIKDVYEIINKHVFNSVLTMPPIEFAKDFIGTNHIAGYNYKCIMLSGTTSYTLVTKPVRIQNGTILIPPRILINPVVMHNGIALMFFVFMLAHEMIHQDDVINGTLLKRRYDAMTSNKKDFNSHRGYFENFADAINKKFNLDVQEAIPMSIEHGVDMSLNAVRKLLLEQDHALHEESSNLSELADEAILKRHINAMNGNSQEICTYLGNGAFDVIMF